MKKDIHPKYYTQAKISCACGAVYAIGSTVKDAQIELCAKCHPFFTGEQKILDTARRVEKFNTRVAKKAGTKTGKKVKREKRVTQKKEKLAQPGA